MPTNIPGVYAFAQPPASFNALTASPQELPFATLPNYTADPWWATRAEDLASGNYYPGSAGSATVYSITMEDNSEAPVSYAKLFGTQSLWFFSEGSAQ